jgi:hypothetical protein
MRAMRNPTLALCALVLCAGCGNETKNAADMSMMPDLAPAADLAVRVPNGVACGNMTCMVGQDCCVTTSGNMASGATCVASASQCSGGSVLACDGPEDCNDGTMPYCCATIMLAGGGPDGGTPMFNGGDSSCTAACNLGFGAGNSLTTRLCHSDTDCMGLTIPITNQSSVCCSSTMAPGLHFCATPVSQAGVTCP